ncbi:hypothetical protein D9M71_741340 [compost metagenome]
MEGSTVDLDAVVFPARQVGAGLRNAIAGQLSVRCIQLVFGAAITPAGHFEIDAIRGIACPSNGVPHVGVGA